MITEGVLEKFQACLEKYLSGINEFRAVPIVMYKQSELQSVVTNALADGVGLSILIMPPTPVTVLMNIPNPVIAKLRCEVRVIEDLATNRTGQTAIYIAERVMHYLHLWYPCMADMSDKLMLSANTPWKATQTGSTNTISLFFETHCSLKG